MEDLRSINAHLDNLEAKLRNTFVEIDSRITKLEGVKESSSEERIQELEDLMLLTQIENAKMKESAGSTASFIATDGKNFDERMAALESDMSNLKASNPAFHDSNDMEERISAIEKRIDSLPESGKETFTKELSAIKSDDLSGVESRLDALENRLGSVDGKSVVPKELYDKIASLEDKLEGLSSPDASVLTMKKRMDGIESQLKNGASGDVAAIKKKIEDMESRLNRPEKIPDGEVAAIQKKIENIESHLNRPEKISKSDVQEYINKLLSARDEVQSDITKLSSMKSELEEFSSTHSDMEKKLGSVQVSAERANAFYAKAKNIEETLDSKVSEVNSLAKNIEGKLNGSLNTMESVRKDVNAKVDAMEEKIEARLERLDAVKESLDLKFKEIQSKMSELKELEAKVAQLSTVKPPQNDADKTIRAVQELQERFEEESVLRASVDKAMQDIKRKMENIEKSRSVLEKERTTAADMAKGSWNYASNLEKRVEELEHELTITSNLRMELDNESASRLAVEKDFDGMREKVASLEKGVTRLFREAPRALPPKSKTPAIHAVPNDHIVDISNAKPAASSVISQQTDEELEKHMADFKNQMNTMRSRLLQEGEEFSRFMKEADISQIRHEMQEHQKTLKSVDKKIEKSATKFFAENLEEFAKALDRNMPAFVTRDRYEQDIKRIEGTLKNVAAPDIAPLYDRMDMLERDVGQLVLSLRTMLMRVPIIVE